MAQQSLETWYCPWCGLKLKSTSTEWVCEKCLVDNSHRVWFLCEQSHIAYTDESVKFATNILTTPINEQGFNLIWNEYKGKPKLYVQKYQTVMMSLGCCGRQKLITPPADLHESYHFCNGDCSPLINWRDDFYKKYLKFTPEYTKSINCIEKRKIERMEKQK